MATSDNRLCLREHKTSYFRVGIVVGTAKTVDSHRVSRFAPHSRFPSVNSETGTDFLIILCKIYSPSHSNTPPMLGFGILACIDACFGRYYLLFW